MRIHSILGIAMIGVLAGCASRGTMYSRNDAGKPWTVQEATVVQVTEATIEGREQGQIGTFGGGFIGHAVGHSIGHGAGSSIAGAVGAVAGAIVGQQPRRRRPRSAPGRSWWSWKAARKRSRSCSLPIRTSAPARRFASTRARTARRASPSSSSASRAASAVSAGPPSTRPARDRPRSRFASLFTWTAICALPPSFA